MIVRNIRNCARCGGHHPSLEAFELARPMAPPECAPLEWTHYAMCPNGCGPIMISHGAPAELNAPHVAVFASLPFVNDNRFPSACLIGVHVEDGRPWHHVNVYLTPEDFVSHDVHEWIRTQLGPRCVSITIKAVHS